MTNSSMHVTTNKPKATCSLIQVTIALREFVEVLLRLCELPSMVSVCVTGFLSESNLECRGRYCEAQSIQEICFAGA